MKLPDAILAKTLARFDSLIAEGRNILAAAQDVPPAHRTNDWTNRSYQVHGGYKLLDSDKFIEWRTKATTLMAIVIPKGHVHRDSAQQFGNLQCSAEMLQGGISMLRGIKDDLEKGFLDDLATAVEAEVACDYMGQAELLLAEGQRGKFDHVPAAVLAGAVLEKALRKLCDQQQPPISQKDAKGNHRTLSPLVDELKKAGVFNEAKAKQLRAWADIRNLAAHGEFNQFKRADVEGMLAGINNFIADHLK